MSAALARCCDRIRIAQLRSQRSERLAAEEKKRGCWRRTNGCGCRGDDRELDLPRHFLEKRRGVRALEAKGDGAAGCDPALHIGESRIAKAQELETVEDPSQRGGGEVFGKKVLVVVRMFTVLSWNHMKRSPSPCNENTPGESEGERFVLAAASDIANSPGPWRHHALLSESAV